MSKRITYETLKREKQDILQFALSNLVPSEGKIFVQDIFHAYQDWRIDQHLGDSELSVDGFGRLFPKNFQRRTLYVDGEIRKGIHGVSLIK